MRWRGRRESGNIEDRRDFRRARGGGLGGLGGGLGGGRRRIPIGGKGGLGGLGLVAVVVIVLLMGGDPTALLTGGGPGFAPVEQARPVDPAHDPQAEMKAFVAVVLADTETTWNRIFREMGATYAEPTLVLFDDDVRSACGFATSATGPFYCPGDNKVYLDMAFFRDLSERFGAPGDFAQAYVIAHEVGHHVQELLGVLHQAQAIKQRVSEAEANAVQVRVELQADCFAGVWGHHAENARDLLDGGDLDEALRAAEAIGDDRLQRAARGHVTPDSFTHGTSEQRARWFRRGFETGDAGACDTFAADAP